MSDQNAEANNPTLDPWQYLGMVRNPDGTITRKSNGVETSTTSSDPDTSCSVLSKDITLNQSNQTWLRLYLPREALDSCFTTRLPLLVYYHGGGFVLASAATSLFDDFCKMLAAEIPAVVVSVEYRLAPEHRLPAAYDDCVEALHLIKTNPDEWLTKYADLSRCYVMGNSAGGNIAYHVGLRVAESTINLEPLRIRGLILHQPFFGGNTRTPSELKFSSNKVIPLSATDLMWELCLPIGVDRDHEYSNPTAIDASQVFYKVKALGWKVLVVGCDGDILFDRQIWLAKMLKEKGVQIVQEFEQGGYHGIDLFEPPKAKKLCLLVKDFVLSSLAIA